MGDMDLGILDKLSFDRYYKIISPSGVIFCIFGALNNNAIVIKFGVLTFIYGILAWMIGSTFDVKGILKIPNNWKLEPGHLIWAWIILQLVLFFFYVYKVINLFS